MIYFAIKLKSPIIEHIVDTDKFIEFLKEDYWITPNRTNQRTVEGVILRTLMDFTNYCSKRSTQALEQKRITYH